MAIPTFAEVVNDNLQKVTLTASDLKLLFDAGLLTASVTIDVDANSLSSLKIKNMTVGATTTISRGQSATYVLDSSEIVSYGQEPYNTLNLLVYSPFVLIGPSGAASTASYTISYNFQFSFEGYVSPDTSFITQYFVGSDDFKGSQTIRVFDVNTSSTYSQSSSTFTGTTLSPSDIYIYYIFYQFGFTPKNSTFSAIFNQILVNTPLCLTNNVVFSMAGDSLYSRAEVTDNPLAFAISEFEFYEYVEPDPDPDPDPEPDPDPDPEPDTSTSDLSEVISILRDVSSSDQEKIDNLKQAFDDVDEDLKDAADQMEVEIPDISDSVSSIPSDLMQGNEMVSQQILAPILNIQPLATIFLGVFAILAIKLLLFGSGPH